MNFPRLLASSLIEFQIEKERKSESAEKINADDNNATKLTAFDKDFGHLFISFIVLFVSPFFSSFILFVRLIKHKGVTSFDFVGLGAR